ncbi:MAG: hypothetical protein ACJ8AD_07155 [Gemmatimonadaceae bacterium]
MTPLQRPRRSAGSRLVATGLLIGVVDGLWAVVLTLAYGRSLTRLWQGIAATAFGERMFDGGAPAVLLGVLMHFGVAFAWSAAFLLLVTRSAWLRRVLDSPHGMLKVAAVYGPMIWIVMSAVVIPLLTGRPLAALTGRWWIQLAGHVVFVGVPIVWSTWRGSRSATA